MDIAGMEHLTHFWALVYVTCNVWSNTFVCGCTHTVFSLERWHSFVKWGFCFVPEALVSQLETDEWNALWVDETHKVRKWRYNSCGKHVVLVGSVCVLLCWPLGFAVTGSSEREGMSTPRICCFCFHTFYLWSMFGKYCFPLVRPGRDFRLSLRTNQNPVLYMKDLFWLINRI